MKATSLVVRAAMLLALVTPSLALAEGGGVDFGSLLDPGQALRTLPEQLAKFYPSFQLIGFLILCIGLVVSLYTATNVQANINAVAKACVLTGVIALIPVIAGQISSMANGLANQLDQGGIQTAQAIVTTSIGASEFFSMNEKSGEGVAEAKELVKKASWWQVPIIYAKGAIQDTVQGAVALVSLVSAIPEALVRIVLCVVFMIAMLICYVIQYFLGWAQFFILNAALIFMPVFVAGLGTTFYRGQSVSFISGWIGVACWPIGWGLWNIGTIALCDVIAAFIKSLVTIGIPAGAAMGSVVPGAGTAAGAVAASQLSLIMLVVLSIMLFAWVVAGAFAAPILIQKMVTSGSNFFAGAVTAGGGAALAAAGTALKVGASVAAPGAGTAAAGTGGSLMQALSRGSLETGFDVGSMMSAVVPNVSDLADPTGDPSSKMYPKSETARRSAARDAIKQSAQSIKGFF